jgi:hypothetical protein
VFTQPRDLVGRQKWETSAGIARSCRCRAATQIYAAITLYSEPTNERFIVSLMGHLREGCGD